MIKLTNVHTSLLEGDEHVDIVGLGTDGSNDRGLLVSFCPDHRRSNSYLSEVLLLGGKVIEASSELGVPSKLGEGLSRRCELSHVDFTVLITVVIVDRFFESRRGRSGSRWSECGCVGGGYR